MLRVALIAESDGPGGAGRSARELHSGFQQRGMRSRMFVSHRSTTEANVHRIPRTLARVRAKLEFEAVEAAAHERTGWFSANLLPDAKWARVRAYRPDVVSLHWVNAGHVGIESLPLLPRPLVWTLHDMWPLTGGCHYDDDCGRFEEACGACPVLGSSSERDLSRFIYRRKRAAWRGLDPVFIVASDWMQRAVDKSSLFGGAPVVKIPRPIDTDGFAPQDREHVRASLHLSANAFVVACGAHGLFTDVNKGWDVLSEALSGLAVAAGEVVLLLFGATCDASLPLGDVAVRSAGIVDRQSDLAAIYNAADLLVVPSRQEAFGRVGAEALACGTPVIGFRSPGAGELVRDGVTGFAVSQYDPGSLRQALEYAVQNPEQLRWMRKNCRRQAVDEFAQAAVASQYEETFLSALKRETPGRRPRRET